MPKSSKAPVKKSVKAKATNTGKAAKTTAKPKAKKKSSKKK